MIEDTINRGRLRKVTSKETVEGPLRNKQTNNYLNLKRQ